mmetsp:Transcript_19336/g.35914  ORF Transcript_19336/g.35914 Transcript_19336/m.35914 type:complete len:271 (-) Transcript_19336:471-1283(-)
MTQSESWRALSISSSMNSLAPLRTTVDAPPTQPQTYRSSPSPTLSSLTVSAVPRQEASKVSFPSMSAMVTTSFPPVALASLLRSSLLHLRAAMAPASTKYFRHRSSIPLVVRMTFAPESMIFWMRSLVMSISLCLIFSISSGSLTTTCTPMANLCLCRFMSSMAILAFATVVGMPWAARVTLRANPFTMWDSREDFPWALRMWMAEMGYLKAGLPLTVTGILTDLTASTAILEKKTDSGPRILEDIEVLAELIRFWSPRASTGTMRFFLM